MLRALRNIFLEILGLGTIVFPLILVWSWIEHVSVATYVLASLAFSAAMVALLIVVNFATLPIQYFRHRRAFRLRRLAPQSFAYRDPRVIPWWEW